MGWGDRTVRIDPSTLTQIGTSTLARIDVINTGAIALHPLSLSHLLPTIGTKVKLLIEPTDRKRGKPMASDMGKDSAAV